VSITGADWKLILPALLLMVATWGVFAIRWRVLLASYASIRWSDTFLYILIGYFGNAVLPLRLGDVSRIALISRKHRINIGFTFATGVLEKLLDTLTMVALAALLVLFVPVPKLVRHGVHAAAVITISVFALLCLLARMEKGLTRLRLLLQDHLPKSVFGIVFNIINKFVQGLEATKSLKQMVDVSLLSLLSWGLASLSMLCYVYAFRLDVPW
jgi:uncharacterized protein (TIRG00374 family)